MEITTEMVKELNAKLDRADKLSEDDKILNEQLSTLVYEKIQTDKVLTDVEKLYLTADQARLSDDTEAWMDEMEKRYNIDLHFLPDIIRSEPLTEKQERGRQFLEKMIELVISIDLQSHSSFL